VLGESVADKTWDEILRGVKKSRDAHLQEAERALRALKDVAGGGNEYGEEKLVALEDVALTVLDCEWAGRLMDYRRARRVLQGQSTADIDVKLAQVQKARAALDEASRRVAMEKKE
jgi:hypothetical protein